MMEAVSGKNEAHQVMCHSSTEENKWRYKSLENKAKKAVSKATREKAVVVITELQNSQYGMFELVI